MTASSTAKYLIWYAHRHGDPISNLKLQKLLYYAQAWHLALHDRPLFPEAIEAWVHGPVIPSVYVQYKPWSWQPIPAEQAKPSLKPEYRAHLDDVMQVYGSLTALYLERLTHEESPWRKARRGLPPDAPSHNVISHADMAACYKARLREPD